MSLTVRCSFSSGCQLAQPKGLLQKRRTRHSPHQATVCVMQMQLLLTKDRNVNCTRNASFKKTGTGAQMKLWVCLRYHHLLQQRENVSIKWHIKSQRLLEGPDKVTQEVRPYLKASAHTSCDFRHESTCSARLKRYTHLAMFVQAMTVPQKTVIQGLEFRLKIQFRLKGPENWACPWNYVTTFQLFCVLTFLSRRQRLFVCLCRRSKRQSSDFVCMSRHAAL